MKHIVEFTKDMKKDFTILAPNMLPVHFQLIEKVFKMQGYNLEILSNDGKEVIEEGLMLVHNDTCYPALLVIGQMISALKSGKYDIYKTALMITQTGGGCRASNYIHLLRKALKKAGLGHVPVISLNFLGMEKHSGFKITIPFLRSAMAALAYGDILMLLKNQVQPYEIEKGRCDAIINNWVEILANQLVHNKQYKLDHIKANMESIVHEFSLINTTEKNKVKVGIVGEIYVKYSPLGNNNLLKFLETQDCEVMVPGLMGFIQFCIVNNLNDIKLYGGSKIKYKLIEVAYKYMRKIEQAIIEAVEHSGKFIAPANIEELQHMVDGVIGLGAKMGEGWLLTAEMVELIDKGYENIICTQPFGCLPNHIVGKGMIRKIKQLNNNANIVPIDYDPGATRVNQENRIKLMISVAKENKRK